MPYDLQFRTDGTFDVIHTATGNAATFYSRETAETVINLLNVDALRWTYCAAKEQRKDRANQEVRS